MKSATTTLPCKSAALAARRSWSINPLKLGAVLSVSRAGDPVFRWLKPTRASSPTIPTAGTRSAARRTRIEIMKPRLLWRTPVINRSDGMGTARLRARRALQQDAQAHHTVTDTDRVQRAVDQATGTRTPSARIIRGRGGEWASSVFGAGTWRSAA